MYAQALAFGRCLRGGGLIRTPQLLRESLGFPMLRTLFVPPLAFCFLVGCGSGCEEDADPSRDPGGSVARAADLTATQRTEDGYEIISATPRQRRTQNTKNQNNRDNLILEPTSPDPEAGEFTIDEAVEGLGTDGGLVAEFSTTLGTFFCDLHTDEAPNTVANFIGLARGRRAWWDARRGEWRTHRYYDGLSIHRVIPDYLVQGGDYLDGEGGPIGYTIDDEPHDNLSHDRAGQLCMASTGENINGAEFFITDGARPELDEDGQFTIFGQCRPVETIARLARVPQADDNRPITPLRIHRVFIQRVRGGAANATRTQPRLPEGYDPETTPYQASDGPSEMAIPGNPLRSKHGGVFDPRNWNNMRPNMR